jgi:hypothetical protein
MQVVRADRPLPVVASRPRFAALANDGPRDAAAARDAAQAFQRYVEGLAKAGARPDLTRPDVAKLLR